MSKKKVGWQWYHTIDLALSYSRWNFETNLFSPHPLRGLKILSEPCFYYLQTIIVSHSVPDPGSELSPSRIPYPGSASKNLSILAPKKPKKWFLSSRKYDPGCSSRIPDPDADFLPIPDPGSGSATLVSLPNIRWKIVGVIWMSLIFLHQLCMYRQTQTGSICVLCR